MLCEGEQVEHSHQRLVREWTRSLSGVALPFLVGCQSSAMCGASVVITLVTEVFLKVQKGQRVRSLVRSCILVDHSWSGPFLHFQKAR